MARHIRRSIAAASGAVMVLLVLVSCPEPFDATLARQALDRVAPGIVITSPEDGTTYGAAVVVAGTVTDADAGQIAEVRIRVPAAEVDQVVQIDSDGAFSFTLSTANITTAVVIRLSARDWSGNVVETEVTLFNDGTGPAVTISEPADMSYYGSVVRVSGRVTDGDGLSTTNEVKSASYAVPGTTVAGDLVISADGAFSFDFTTKDASGVQIIDGARSVQVTGTDWNGNSTTSSITILRADGGNDIGSFSITTGNKSVMLEWDDVLYAERYTLHNPRYGDIREGVTSPYVWDGLDNGFLYSFQLQAEIPAEKGPDSFSDLRDVVPLDVRTLSPWVREQDYRSVTVEWRDIDAPTEYKVERRINDGAWSIRSITPDSEFTDSGLSLDTWYEYRVTALAQPDVVSVATPAVAGRFPWDKAAGLGRVDVGGAAWGVAVYNGYVCLADFESGLKVIDASNPWLPTLVGTYDTPGSAVDVAINWPYAYVADDSWVTSTSGLHVIDLSTPASPVHRGSVDTTGSASGVAVVGSYAYVADTAPGLRVVDVSNPDNPYERTGVYDTGAANDLVVEYPYAFVADSGGLRIVNIGNPNSLSLVGSLSAGVGASYDIAVSGSTAYIASYQNGLRIIDVGTLSAPLLRSTWPTTASVDGVVVSGPYAFVANRQGGLEVLNVADPTAPIRAGGYDTGGLARSVAIDGVYAYVADGMDNQGGLDIVDVANPTFSPYDLQYDTSGDAQGVTVVGDYAYVADGFNGLEVIDITQDPPVRVGGSATTDYARDVVVAGSSAYVIYGYEIAFGMDVFSLANPAAPQWAGGYVMESDVNGIAVGGEHVYLATASTGLEVIDITDPTTPVRVGRYDTTGVAMDVALAGQYAYVADNADGLQVIDVSDPTMPVRVSGYDPGGYARDVAIVGQNAYVGFSTPAGLHIISISNPLSPTHVGDCATTANAMNVAVTGSYALVTTAASGLDVVDIVDPAAPVAIANHPVFPGGLAFGLEVRGSVAYVTEYGAGLHVMDFVDDNP